MSSPEHVEESRAERDTPPLIVACVCGRILRLAPASIARTVQCPLCFHGISIPPAVVPVTVRPPKRDVPIEVHVRAVAFWLQIGPILLLGAATFFVADSSAPGAHTPYVDDLGAFGGGTFLMLLLVAPMMLFFDLISCSFIVDSILLLLLEARGLWAYRPWARRLSIFNRSFVTLAGVIEMKLSVDAEGTILFPGAVLLALGLIPLVALCGRRSAAIFTRSYQLAHDLSGPPFSRTLGSPYFWLLGTVCVAPLWPLCRTAYLVHAG